MRSTYIIQVYLKLAHSIHYSLYMRDARMFTLPDIGRFHTLRKRNKCIIIIKVLAIYFSRGFRLYNIIL